MASADEREMILNKAYELWEAEGRPTGREMEHWFQAEILIAQELSKSKRAAKETGKSKAKAPAKAKAPTKAKAKSATKTKAPAGKSSVKSKS